VASAGLAEKANRVLMPQQLWLLSACLLAEKPMFSFRKHVFKKAGGGHRERPVINILINILKNSKIKTNDDDAGSDEDL
jgi:hypothetical protein